MTRTPLTTPTLLLLAVLAGCSRSPAVGRVVRIATPPGDSVELLSLPYLLVGAPAEGWAAAWVAPGSLLGGRGAALYPYTTADGDSLQLEFASWNARLSGRVIALDLDEDSAAAWLSHASEPELAQLRYLAVDDSLPATLRPALERLAAVNSRLALSFESADEVEALLPLLRPRWLSLPEPGDSVAPWLTDQQQLETLYCPCEDSASVMAIPGLAGLRSLWVGGDAGLRVDQLPSGLEELSFIFDGPVDLTGIGGLSHLRALRLVGTDWQAVPDLAPLKKLRWLGFPSNATQAEFAAIIEGHPELEVIELLEVDSVRDLSPLRSLRHLRAVTLRGDFQELGVLREIPSLEYVGLSDEIWSDAPAEAAAIQAALPGAVVVKTFELCLGSGWILLLIPAVLLFARGKLPRRFA